MSIQRRYALGCSNLALTLLACAMLGGCALRDSLLNSSPRDNYASMLRRAGLDTQALGVQWLRAGETALQAPVAATTPFSETAYFPADVPMAVGYQLELQRGRVLQVEVEVTAEDATQLFVELYERRNTDAPRRVAALAPTERSVRYEVERDGLYILRVQPELLRSGRFTLTQRTLASLPFPVQGVDVQRVQSLFGAARDAGARRHDGIDIFADRGTPAVAVSAGSASVGTNNLGGNVVWLRDGGTGRRYYYAHLDRWAFDGTMAVQPGDVLGYIGNTGNARTTSPHLHFGVYADGAVNPLPFLRPDDAAPTRAVRGAMHLGEQVRLLRQAALSSRVGEGAARSRAMNAATLPRDSLVVVLGASDDRLRVRVGDAEGYLSASVVTGIDPPVRRSRLVTESALRDGPRPTAPIIEVLPRDAVVDVLGRFDVFRLIRRADGRAGWVEDAVLQSP